MDVGPRPQDGASFHLVVGQVVADYVVDAIDDFLIFESRDDPFVEIREDGVHLFDAKSFDVFSTELVGMLTLKVPGGGPPVCLGGFFECLQRHDLSGQLGVAELVVEFGVPHGLASDGNGGRADVAGGVRDTAAGRYEGTNFASFDIVESTWSWHVVREPPGTGEICDEAIPTLANSGHMF
jgi:hypothetical protein